MGQSISYISSQSLSPDLVAAVTSGDELEIHRCLNEDPKLILAGIKKNTFGITRTSIFHVAAEAGIGSSIDILCDYLLTCSAEIFLSLVSQLSNYDSVANVELVNSPEGRKKAVSFFLNGSNGRGQTPLMYSCFYGWPDVIVTLLKHGSDPWIQDRCGGRNALHYACLKGHAQCVRVLIQHVTGRPAGPLSYHEIHDRQYVNCRTMCGVQPIHLAVAKGHYEAVRALLAFRPRLTAFLPSNAYLDSIGGNFVRRSTPLHIAAGRGDVTLSFELMAAYARQRAEGDPYGESDPRRIRDGLNMIPCQVAHLNGHISLAEALLPARALTTFTDYVMPLEDDVESEARAAENRIQEEKRILACRAAREELELQASLAVEQFRSNGCGVLRDGGEVGGGGGKRENDGGFDGRGEGFDDKDKEFDIENEGFDGKDEIFDDNDGRFGGKDGRFDGEDGRFIGNINNEEDDKDEKGSLESLREDHLGKPPIVDSNITPLINLYANALVLEDALIPSIEAAYGIANDPLDKHNQVSNNRNNDSSKGSHVKNVPSTSNNISLCASSSSNSFASSLTSMSLLQSPPSQLPPTLSSSLSEPPLPLATPLDLCIRDGFKEGDCRDKRSEETHDLDPILNIDRDVVQPLFSTVPISEIPTSTTPTSTTPTSTASTADTHFPNHLSHPYVSATPAMSDDSTGLVKERLGMALCGICFSDPAYVSIQNCAHRTCGECALKLCHSMAINKPLLCPYCRTEVNRFSFVSETV